MDTYDLIVIGTGTAAQVAATRVRKAGHSVAVIDVAESVHGYKTLVDEDSGRILGAYLVGPHADEVVNLSALAIRHDLTVDDLRSTIFGYPTGASDIGSML